MNLDEVKTFDSGVDVCGADVNFDHPMTSYSGMSKTREGCYVSVDSRLRNPKDLDDNVTIIHYNPTYLGSQTFSKTNLTNGVKIFSR